MAQIPVLGCSACDLVGRMKLRQLFPLASAASLFFSGSSCAAEQNASAALAAAQKAKDQSAVERLVAEYVASRGDRIGEEEEETSFSVPEADAKALEFGPSVGAFGRILESFSAGCWWKSAESPAEIPAPLRNPAAVVDGCASACLAEGGDRESWLREAEAAAEFLLRAQDEGGHGCFPFPAWRGKRGKLGAMSERYLAAAEREGRLNQIVSHGWIVDDEGRGDLQFDNGVSGLAVLHLYELTKKERLLDSAKAAGVWALAQPSVPNWNYNAFSLNLLSELYRVTGEKPFLEAAREKFRLGVQPGQLKEGKSKGRWADPHNARLVYHFILIRGILGFHLALPEGDKDRESTGDCLKLALAARNAEILANGAAHPETTLEVYSLLMMRKNELGSLLTETKTPEAAALTFRHASDELRHEHPTISPAAWGAYLRYLRSAVPTP